MKKSITIIISIIISILLVIGFISIILFKSNAKYINYKEMNHYYSSSELYISSTILSENNKNNIINNYNFETLEFIIKNSLNNNQITNYNIDYTIECQLNTEASQYYTCNLDNASDNTIIKK